MTDYLGFSVGRSSDINIVPNKNVVSKEEALKQFRALISANEELGSKNFDDTFLLKFLYARKMRIEESLNLLANYFSYRERNKEIFENLSVEDPLIKQALYEGFPGVLPEKDRRGRCVLVFFCNNWEQANYPLEVVYRALLITLDSLLEETANQVNGFVVIVDWTDVTFSQVMSISPRILKLMIEGLQDCYPARFKGIHFLNQPWYIERVLSIIKSFLKEKTNKKIYVHGNNLASLHSHVTPAILPSELGGECPPFTPTPWAYSVTTRTKDEL